MVMEKYLKDHIEYYYRCTTPWGSAVATENQLEFQPTPSKEQNIVSS